MNKIKDIIYDKNDMLIAFIIIIIAAFIIYTRIGVIMDYPAVLAAEAEAVLQNQEQEWEDPYSDGASDNNAVIDEENKDHDPIVIQIPSGANMNQIGQVFIDSALASTMEEFYDAVKAAGVETRLRAGKFELPPDTTLQQAIRAVSN